MRSSGSKKEAGKNGFHISKKARYGMGIIAGKRKSRDSARLMQRKYKYPRKGATGKPMKDSKCCIKNTACYAAQSSATTQGMMAKLQILKKNGMGSSRYQPSSQMN